MCGRLNVTDHPGVRDLMAGLGQPIYPVDRPARYNIAPGAELDVIYQQDKELAAIPMNWGIVPPWKKGLLINARAETIHEKPTFKRMFENQRIVIPATGFYEWQREGKIKRPFHFTPNDAELFLMAGIWGVTKEGEQQCCIVTTGANEIMQPIHHRMPLLLAQNKIDGWIRGSSKEASELLSVPVDSMLSGYEVSSYVSNARNDGPECVEPKGIK